MSEELNPKKIIKKKIKLKVAAAPDKPAIEEKEEKITAVPEVQAAPVVVAAAVPPAAPAPVTIHKPKPDHTPKPHPKPDANAKPVDPTEHLRRMNEKFGKLAGNTPSPQQEPFRRFENRPPSSGATPRPGGFSSGGGAGRPPMGGGAGGVPGRRTFTPRDRNASGDYKPRTGGGTGGGYRPQTTETTTGEKDHGRNKHRSTFNDKIKTSKDIKEKTKNREEAILLSKLEDSVRKKSKRGEAAIPTEIEVSEVIKVTDLAKKMNLKAGEIIQKLIALGVTATINDNIDADTASIVASEFNCKVVVRSLKEELEVKEDEDKPEDLKPRFPVVTIMGHVDHGKTSLLDAIRNSSVAAHETGGITQHIGAYKVKTKKGEITFVDTPGHEAFTAMRARGANVTDIVILVVSAGDGVMPQTVEALNHAKAAKVPIIVAVNKMDLPDANPERVKQQLAEHSILSEDWGGDNIFINVSAVKKTGIQELLDAILLQAEVLDLKANPTKRGIGFVIESKMDIGRGAVATVIVKNGCIKVGDNFLAGNTMGKVRGMFDEKGTKMTIAEPSFPVEIMGFDSVPNAGDKFYVVESDEYAKQMSAKRQDLKKIEDNRNIKKMQMQNAMDAMTTGAIKELKVIIKGDVHGSVEAIRASLTKLVYSEVKVTVIQAGVGSVLESDIMLASSTANTAETGVIILAFRVRVDSIAKEKAESEGVIIKRFNIIYELIDYIDGIMKGMLTPEVIEKIIGTAEITDIFKIKETGKIAGAKVKEGFIRKNEKVRLYREEVQVWEGKINALKRFKDDASEVQEGFEFGISFVNYENFKKGDIIECFSSEVKKTQ